MNNKRFLIGLGLFVLGVAMLYATPDSDAGGLPIIIGIVIMCFNWRTK